MHFAADEPVVALVAAAGSGSRLGGAVTKALRPLAGVPLVTHSVARLAAGGVDRAVVIVPEGRQPDFEQALAAAPIPWQLVIGGSERQHSVRRGLRAVGEAGPVGVVLVHDAARPLVPASVVRAVIAAVRRGHRAVVPTVPVVDSVRRMTRGAGPLSSGADGADEANSEIIDRSTLRAVQTPQGFEYATLIAAHDHIAHTGVAVTDDATCCEAIGEQVHLVPGSRLALKVTEPIDLVVAEALYGAYAGELHLIAD